MGCCSLDAGKVPQRCLQQIANRLFLDVLFQASATAGKRIPLYLGVHEARTPNVSYEAWLPPDSLVEFLHLDRRSDDGSHAHAFPVPMHAYVGQAWAANWCVPGPQLLGNAFRLESRHSVRWDQSATQHEQPHSFQPSPSSQLAAHCFKQRFLILHKESQQKHSKLQPST